MIDRSDACQPPHLPDRAFYDALPVPTRTHPISIMVSGCVFGQGCGVDGSDYGPHELPRRLLSSERVRPVPFCPENFAFGTPRMLCDIDEGTGFDVLAGNASVIAEDGSDWTDGLVDAAGRMVELATANGARIALLLDISAACGSQVIYQGPRSVDSPRRRPGMGVAAAALSRAGLRVISQRDFAALRRLFEFVGATWPDGAPSRDHHQSDWYVEAFGERGWEEPQ